MNDDLNRDLNPESSDATRALPAEPQAEREVEPEVQPEPTYAYEEPELTLIPEATAARRTGSHPVNVGQLAMGLVFLAAVGVWALIQSDTVSGDDIRWLLPLPWVIGGGIGLVAATISSVRRHGIGR